MLAGKRLEPASPAGPGLQVRKGRSGTHCNALCSDLQSPKAAACVQQRSVTLSMSHSGATTPRPRSLLTRWAARSARLAFWLAETGRAGPNAALVAL